MRRKPENDPGGSPGREPGSCPEGSEGDGSAVSLHGLTSMTLGVPDVEAVASYYEDFGRRRVVEIGIGADDPDDLSRIEASLRRLGAEFERDAESLRVRDPNSALQVS